MSIQVAVGLGTEKDALQALQSALRQAGAQMHAQRSELALIFSSVEFAHPQVLRAAAGLLPQTQIIGCSSLGVITDQGIAKYGLAVMLVSLGEDARISTAQIQDISAKSAVSAGEELGARLLSGCQNARRDFGLIFSDGLIKDAGGFLNGLQERLGASFPIAGASASDNLRFLKTYTYAGGEVSSDSACGILWGGKLSFGLGIKHGWKPLGKPCTVTKSIGNAVYEIDGASATNIYEEYFSCDLNKLKRDTGLISIFYPIGIYLSGEREYLLRNIQSMENNGSLNLRGNVPEGSLIRLMIGTKESCLAATREAALAAQKALGPRQTKFVLVFDSISRYMLLGRGAQKELAVIREVFGGTAPIFGLYTYGEQAPLQAINYQGRAYFHNQTITLLRIGG